MIPAVITAASARHSSWNVVTSESPRQLQQSAPRDERRLNAVVVPVEFLVGMLQKVLTSAGDGDTRRQRPLDACIEPRVGGVVQLLQRPDMEQMDVCLAASPE